MTADVVSLAEHRAARSRTARERAAESGHPCAGNALARAANLVRVGTGRAAHAVQLTVDVPADAPAGRVHGPHTAVVTWCGRAARASELSPPGDADTCVRCAGRLLAAYQATH